MRVSIFDFYRSFTSLQSITLWFIILLPSIHHFEYIQQCLADLAHLRTLRHYLSLHCFLHCIPLQFFSTFTRRRRSTCSFRCLGSTSRYIFSQWCTQRYQQRKFQIRRWLQTNGRILGLPTTTFNTLRRSTFWTSSKNRSTYRKYQLE